jgi:hypothetical protein
MLQHRGIILVAASATFAAVGRTSALTSESGHPLTGTVCPSWRLHPLDKWPSQSHLKHALDLLQRTPEYSFPRMLHCLTTASMGHCLSKWPGLPHWNQNPNSGIHNPMCTLDARRNTDVVMASEGILFPKEPDVQISILASARVICSIVHAQVRDRIHREVCVSKEKSISI